MALPTPEMMCACKLFYDTGNETFPYTFCGSGFMISFSERLYLATLRHCVRSDMYDAVCVPVDPSLNGSRGFVRFDLASVPSGDPNDVDFPEFADMLLMRSPEKSVVHPLLTVTDETIMPADSPNVRRILVRGYPRVLNEIDYQGHTIRTKALLAEGSVQTIKKNKVSDHCYTFEFTKPAGIDCMDGISGSPVFAIDMRDKTRLVGVVSRGGSGNTLGFIGVEVLYNMLKSL